MSVFKCKCCGGDLPVGGNEKVVECEYCLTKQTVPNDDDEKKVNLFNRANRLRMSCEFDKAASIYEQIIAEFPEESEAYWGLCLANYGIEYVDDPATARKIPTCHRASFEKLRKDENYELALENADTSARIVYEEQAKEIDRIMSGILSVSRDEKPYDIFICYKETDSLGSRTPDSVLAQEIHDALTAKDYRVFFSRVTLEDKLGTQYEPYIFSALNSAKMMLVVGTDYEYVNSVWVKNEWSRFIKLMAKDKSKILIPCYKDMDIGDMPDEFKGFQGQNCGKLGFMQDLVRGIDKIFGRTEQKSEKIVEKVIVQQGSGVDEQNLLKRMNLFLQDGDWAQANTYAEKVLDSNAECAEAYLGKLMVDLKVHKQDELKDCAEPFDNNKNYRKILDYAGTNLSNALEKNISFIKDRNENARLNGIYNDAANSMNKATNENIFRSAAQKFRSISGFRDSDQLADECDKKAIDFVYNRAFNNMRTAKTESQFMSSANDFKSISAYRDVDEILDECLQKAEISRKDEIYLYAKGRMAENSISAYDEAIEYFKKISEWRDSDTQIEVCMNKISKIKKQNAINSQLVPLENAKNSANRFILSKNNEKNDIQQAILSFNKRNAVERMNIIYSILIIVPFALILIFALCLPEGTASSIPEGTASSIASVLFGVRIVFSCLLLDNIDKSKSLAFWDILTVFVLMTVIAIKSLIVFSAELLSEKKKLKTTLSDIDSQIHKSQLSICEINKKIESLKEGLE